MSELGRILGEQLGGDTPSTADALAELRDRAGSGRKAAALMGVNESVFRRLAAGKTRHPKPGTLQKLDRALRAARVEDRAAQALKLKVTMEGRERSLGRGAFVLKPGGEEAVRQAYVVGGDEEAADQFIEELEDQWYADLVHEINDPDYDAGVGAGDYEGAFV